MNNDSGEIIDAEVVESDNLPAIVETHQRSAPINEVDPRHPWLREDGTPERRCRAHKKTGEQCKNAAILGTTVCRFHGGAAKHVKAAARARLENAADRMARNLLGLATEADSSAVRLGATNSALDRAGLKAPAEIELSQGETKPWEEVYEGIAGGTRAESRRARGVLETDAGDAPATQPNGPSPNLPPNTTSPAESFATHGHAVEPLGGYEIRDPRPSASTQTAEPSGRDAQQRGEAPRRVNHVTGDDALRVAADLAREQLALTSPHKRYRRP